MGNGCCCVVSLKCFSTIGLKGPKNILDGASASNYLFFIGLGIMFYGMVLIKHNNTVNVILSLLTNKAFKGKV